METKHIIVKRWPFKNKGAITIGPWILYRSKEDKELLMQHELLHVEQWKKKGLIRWYLSYAVEHAKHGWKGNKYEKEAKKKDKH